MKFFFCYLDIVYVIGSMSFKYLFMFVFRFVCGKWYWGKYFDLFLGFKLYIMQYCVCSNVGILLYDNIDYFFFIFIIDL